MKITKQQRIVSDLKLNESVLISIDFDNLDSDIKTISTDLKTLSIDVKTLSTDVSSNVKSLSDDINGLKDTIENLTSNGCSCDLEQLSTDILEKATKEISGDSQVDSTTTNYSTSSYSVELLQNTEDEKFYSLYNFNVGCANGSFKYLSSDEEGNRAFGVDYYSFVTGETKTVPLENYDVTLLTRVYDNNSNELIYVGANTLAEFTKGLSGVNEISGDSQLEDTLSKSVALSSIDGKNCYTLHRFNDGCADAYLTQEAPYEYLDYNNFAISYYGENDMLYDYAYNCQLLMRLNKNDSGDNELKYLSLESLTAILTNSIELTDIYDLLDYLSNEITAISSNTNIEEDITNIYDLLDYLSNEITAISGNTNIEEDITNILGLIDLLTDEITAITDIYDLIDYLSDELSVISSSNTDILGLIDYMLSDIAYMLSDIDNIRDGLNNTWIKGGTYGENYGASIGDEYGCEVINLTNHELIGSWNQSGGTMYFYNHESNNFCTEINGGTVYAHTLNGLNIVADYKIQIGCTEINEEQLSQLLALLN